MILIICTHCKAGLRVSPGDMRGPVSEAASHFGPGTEMYPDAFPCFRCGKHATFTEAAHPSALGAVDLYDVSPQEALAALGGLGLPSERDCSVTAVTQLFSEKAVKSIRARAIRHSPRCVLDAIEFEDGTRLYLGSSAYGATAYRIAPPHSYAKENDRG